MQAERVLDGSYCFGDFTLDPGRGVLLRGNSVVRLRPQSFKVLQYLIENHGRLVSRDELFSEIWKDTVVSDGALTQCLIDIRKAIGDHARDAIRTVPRRGYIFSMPVQAIETANADDADPAEANKRPGIGRNAVAAVFLLVLIATAWWVRNDSLSGDTSGTDTLTAMPRSIAVLPFVDMSEGKDHEYFSDGLSEEILNLLAQIPEMRVVARTSSFSFKNQSADIEAIADQLNVAWVLEGSVRQSGDQVRVTAQLVNARNSMHVWSQTYDRPMNDVLEIQTDIAQAVADELEVKMLGPGQEKSGVSPQAYQLFMQAQFFHNRRSEGDVEVAQRYYEETVKYDPDFARAWAGLAGVYMIRASGPDYRLWLPKARRATERALAADPDLAEAHARAFHIWTYPWDKRSEHLRRALELDPNSPLVLAVAAGVASFNFDADKAVELQRRAAELDPISATVVLNLGYFLYQAGRYEEAEKTAKTGLELRRTENASPLLPDILLAQRNFDEALPLYEALPAGPERTQRLAMFYHATGQDALSAAALAELTTEPVDPVDATRVAEVHAFRGEYDEAFRWLNQAKKNATNERKMYQIFIVAQSPFLAPMRSRQEWDEWVDWNIDRFERDPQLAGH